MNTKITRVERGWLLFYSLLLLIKGIMMVGEALESILKLELNKVPKIIQLAGPLFGFLFFFSKPGLVRTGGAGRRGRRKSNDKSFG
jgi:hypothetical protein